MTNVIGFFSNHDVTGDNLMQMPVSCDILNNHKYGHHHLQTNLAEKVLNM